MTAAILREARALIERGWTQGTSARNERGEHVGYRSGSAVCWCADGALLRASHSGNEYGAAWALVRAVISTDLYTWNDAHGRTQAEVLEAFDRAIAIAEGT